MSKDWEHEPAPVGNGRIVLNEVMKDLQQKAVVGFEKYGTPLRENNGRNALVDAYQEHLDACMYLKQRIMEEEFFKSDPSSRHPYPSESILDDIKAWSPNGFKLQCEELKSLFFEYGRFSSEVISDEEGKKQIHVYIATGGWSGNEEIIGALQSNFLWWSMNWQSSMRGGAYTFSCPERRW